jgi:signal transduction histidine kinase
VVWSEELYRIYGLPIGTEVTYDAYLERIHPEDRELVDAAVKDAYENHRPFKFEHRIALPDGGARVVEGRGQVVLDGSGRPVRMFGTSQDITEQRRVERLRDDILATVSHEFRTPLAAVVGFSSVLQERWGFLDEEARGRAIGHIAVQARRLERLLTDLLDLDRLRQGIVTPIRRNTDVRQLIEHVAEAHRTHEHPVEIDADPITACIDRPKVERIVENLLANALKHTPRGTAVVVRLEQQGDDLTIVVDDEGVGVPDEFKTAVFDVFDRGRNAMSGETGAGVGLSVVARFAELHGGRAWVVDRDGRGASFRVLLPGCVVRDAALADR